MVETSIHSLEFGEANLAEGAVQLVVVCAHGALSLVDHVGVVEVIFALHAISSAGCLSSFTGLVSHVGIEIVGIGVHCCVGVTLAGVVAVVIDLWEAFIIIDLLVDLPLVDERSRFALRTSQSRDCLVDGSRCVSIAKRQAYRDYGRIITLVVAATYSHIFLFECEFRDNLLDFKNFTF